MSMVDSESVKKNLFRNFLFHFCPKCNEGYCNLNNIVFSFSHNKLFFSFAHNFFLQKAFSRKFLPSFYFLFSMICLLYIRVFRFCLCAHHCISPSCR